MPRAMNQVGREVWKRSGLRVRLVVGENDFPEVFRLACVHLTHGTGKEAVSLTSKEVFKEYTKGKEYGFLWMLLLQAAISAIVQVMIKLWLESTEWRVMIRAARKEAFS